MHTSIIIDLTDDISIKKLFIWNCMSVLYQIQMYLFYGILDNKNLIISNKNVKLQFKHFDLLCITVFNY